MGDDRDSYENEKEGDSQSVQKLSFIFKKQEKKVKITHDQQQFIEIFIDFLIECQPENIHNLNLLRIS